MGRQAEDFEVWEAAQRIIDKYPEEPELAANQLADASWAMGDADKFAFWMRIVKAVRVLVETKPNDRREVN